MFQSRKKHKKIVIHFATSAQAKQVVQKKRTSKWCERMDEQVAQYFSLDSWLFWTTVQRPFFNISPVGDGSHGFETAEDVDDDAVSHQAHHHHDTP